MNGELCIKHWDREPVPPIPKDVVMETVTVVSPIHPKQHEAKGLTGDIKNDFIQFVFWTMTQYLMVKRVTLSCIAL